MRIELHPDNPQPHRVAQVVNEIRRGAVVAYPTDSCYALGCHLGDKTAMERIYAIRRFDRHHQFTLLCADIATAAEFAKIDNHHFRMIKHATPGPYTFVLPATHEVPKRMQNSKRRTIGIRLPDNAVAQALLAELGEPIVTCTAMHPDRELPYVTADDIEDELGGRIDVIVDGGECGLEPTTIVDLAHTQPRIIRLGAADPATLGLSAETTN